MVVWPAPHGASLIAAIIAVSAGLAVQAQPPPRLTASPEIIRDFLIQDACLDAAGKVLAGVSPIDGDRPCDALRDFQPGQTLPYHKHDHPAPRDKAGAPPGYQ